MKLKSLAVKDIGPFEQQTSFAIPKGLSVIYGLNRTSGKNSKNSNWCGKSLFFSTIAELLYDEPIVGSRQDKIKTGSSAVVLEANGETLQLLRQENKLSVKIDGKDQEVLTKTKVQELIKQYWPLTKEEYETFVHIDSRIPHPLVMGSTADRKNFFSAFFGLDKVDAERKLYQAELKKLDRVKEAYDELRSTYALLKRDAVPRSEIAKMQSEKDALQVEFDEKQKQMVEAQEKIRLLDTIESIEKNKTILESKFGVTTQEELIDKLDYYNDALNHLNDEANKALIFSLYQKQLEEYEEHYSQLPDFCKTVSFEKARKGATRYSEAEQEYRQRERYTLKIEKQLSSLQDSVSKPEEDLPEIELGELVNRREALQHQLSHAKKFNAGVCPTCGQSVEIKDPESIENSLAKVRKLIALHKQYQEYQQQLTQITELQKELDEAKAESQKYLQSMNTYKKYADAYDQLKVLPKKPEEPNFDTEGIESPSYYDSKKQKLQKRVNFVSFMKPYIHMIERYNALDDKSRPEIDFASVNALSDRISVLKTKIQMCTQTANKLHDVKERILAMKEQLKDQAPLEYLVEMYADKQIKKRIIQIIGTRLMALVNKYASAIFNEDYKFELVWDTQIHLICKRKAGGNTLVSDVRKLSGAESKLFTVILVLSLLSFVPSDRRPNVMILDEPTANFSSETTKCFQELLQILSQLIESIIVITPRSEDIYPQARCFTVVREGTSRIVEGHPDMITNS